MKPVDTQAIRARLAAVAGAYIDTEQCVGADGQPYYTITTTPAGYDLLASAYADLAALCDEVVRLQKRDMLTTAVAEAADLLSTKVVTDPGWPRLRAALDALDAGGEG